MSKPKCEVIDGRFVEPCKTLASTVSTHALSKKLGVCSWTYMDMGDKRKTATFFGIKSPSYRDGLSFNFCPFCGADITTIKTGREEPS